MEFIVSFFHVAWKWWQALGHDVHYKIWLGAGAIMLVLWLWAAYYVTRRLLGHRRINGAWIGVEEFEAFLDRMVQKEKDGGSLTVADFQMLDKHRPDRRLALKRIGDKDFVSW